MVKRFLMSAVGFVFVMSLIAETEKVGDYTWTYRINCDTVEICGISPKPSGALTIPSVLGGKIVTSIGEQAFAWCDELTSVAIPDSMMEVGEKAFYGCGDSLFDTTTIPGVVLVDGWAIDCDDAISGNLDLTGIRGIGANTFYNCNRLTGVTIPDSVMNIGAWAFYMCSGLTSVTIPSSVASIEYLAFSGCSGLTNVMFTGNAPMVNNGFDFGSGCMAYVKKASTGWGEIPGMWKGLDIQYMTPEMEKDMWLEERHFTA